MKKLPSFFSTLHLFFFILLNLNCVPKKDDFNSTLVLAVVLQSLVASQTAAANSAVQPSCSTPGIPTDPLFSNQWHLLNNGTTTGAVSGEDIRVSDAWNAGCKGNGVRIVTVDDGMDLSHEDLITNYDSTLNVDFSSLGTSGFFNSNSCSTTGLGCHGTAVSGIMAARDGNNIGVVGVAPRAKIGARNVLYNSSDSNSGTAMSSNATNVWVSNNSWGAADNTGQTAASGSLWQAGVESGFTNGRSGKGTLFFWAAGNGGNLLVNSNSSGLVTSGSAPRDNSNHDGQANHFRTFAVAAVGNDGKRASYSEEGANLLITAPSEGTSGVAITTTDITGSGGYNTSGASPQPSNSNYTNSFNGTSAASPVAAGVGALILERNPNLTARDVRVLLARASRQNDTTDLDWITNAGNLKFNHKYGFGVVSASLALTAAQSWTLLGPEVVTAFQTGSLTNATITNNSQTGAVNTVAISNSGIGKVEFVEVNVTVTTGASDDAGDLFIELTSPSGTKARLLVPRICSASGSIRFCNDLTNWTFGATTFMDEPANGTWSLRVADVCNKSPGTGSGTTTCTSSTLYSYTRSDSNFAYTNSKNIANTNHTLSSWSIRIRGRAN